VNIADRIVIAHGHDNDTICSAVVMKRLLENHMQVEPILFPLDSNSAVTEKDADKIREMRPDKIIVVDIAHVSSEAAMEFLDSESTLFIDHHQPIKFERAIYCNPRSHEKRIYMPVSYITYKIYEMFEDPSKVAWVAGIGVLSDHGMAVAGDLFDYIKKIDPVLLGSKSKDEEELFTYSTLGKLAKVLDNARVVKGKEGAIFASKTLARIKSYKSLMTAGLEDTAKLREWNEAANKEFKRLVADFNRKRALLKGKIIFYEIPTKMNMKSSLSGYLTQFCPDNVLVIGQVVDGSLEVSFRRGKNNKTDLNKMAQHAVRGIEGGEGGGHEAASGARVPAKHMAKFLKQL
jgi:single-stranded DNA-specific DHH superfamily exonuclease